MTKAKLQFRPEFVFRLCNLSYPTYRTLVWAVRHSLTRRARQLEFRKYLSAELPFKRDSSVAFERWKAKVGKYRWGFSFPRTHRSATMTMGFTDLEFEDPNIRWPNLLCAEWTIQGTSDAFFLADLEKRSKSEVTSDIYFDKVQEAIQIFKNALNSS